jgi:hypothetical protein
MYARVKALTIDIAAKKTASDEEASILEAGAFC